MVAAVVVEEKAEWYDGGDSNKARGWVIPLFLVEFIDAKRTDYGPTDQPTPSYRDNSFFPGKM